MKYCEIIFDLIYLLYVINTGLYLFRKGKTSLLKKMAFATILLGIGDSFHLIPRVLNNIFSSDFSFYLGIGKLITSITMTFFYIFLYYIYLDNYDIKENKSLSLAIWILSFTRIILCLFPQNGWFSNTNSIVWSIMRNIPFVFLGLLLVSLFYSKREKNNTFRNMWLYILLSFLFYIPVVVGVGRFSLLGMLMIPKTICYIFIVHSFRKKVL